MRPYLHDPVASQLNPIPLLDASSLPADDDWALLESINAGVDASGDFDSDADRFARFRVNAFYDE
ncbi:MAG TPA: hypothetical protein VLG08_07545 [Casimicrobiaceae bacterium]|jgi:hypothetical protein|nr:hypothetical protein [Casimicrobiaceae bacterium]